MKNSYTRIYMAGRFLLCTVVSSLLSLAAFAQPSCLVNTPFKTSITLATPDKKSIESVDYTINIDGKQVQKHIDHPAILSARQDGMTDIEVEGVPLTKAKAYKVNVNIDKVNGLPYAAEQPAATTYQGVIRAASRRTVVEEFTGTGCGYCPRGWVGMEYLKAKYQDKFVGIAFHKYNSSDPMYVANYYPTSSLGITGAPSCNMDRRQEMDPYYGTNNRIEDDFKAFNAELPSVDVSVIGIWNDDQTAVNITANIEALSDGLNFSVAYVLTADNLSGTTSEWKQANYFASYSASSLPTNPDLSQFGSGGIYGQSYVYLTFNDVMIGSSYNNSGTNLAATIPGAGNTQAGAFYQGSHTVSMPTKTILKNAIHHNLVFANVLVIDNTTGHILNAARAAVISKEEAVCELTITSSGNGNTSYDGTTIRDETTSFNVERGTSATLSFSPDADYRLGSLKVNSADVTSDIQDNQYTINNITSNMSVEVNYELSAYTLTANSYTRPYGDENPAFAYTVEGGAITGEPELTCTATKESPVGTYPIVISQGSVEGNHVTLVNGTLTITKAPLTVEAMSYTRKYGEENPVFEILYSGWKLGETENVLNSIPVATTTADIDALPGDYPITVSGGQAKNYSFHYVAGILTVTEPDPVIYTANSYTREYGEENPSFICSIEGEYVGMPDITCSATKESPVGTYDIVLSKGDIDYPNVTLVNGTLTITEAPLTARAKPATRKYGEADPVFEIEYIGWKLDDTAEVLIQEPTATTTATATSSPGQYTITLSGGEAQNYSFNYIEATLTIEKGDQTLTWEQEFTDVEQYSQIELTAEASSGLPVSYTVSDETVCLVTTTDQSCVLDCIGVGETTICAEQPGDTNWWPTAKTYKTIRIVNTSGIDHATAKASGQDGAAYDLQGRKLNPQHLLRGSRLKKGVYIVNGKKTIL